MVTMNSYMRNWPFSFKVLCHLLVRYYILIYFFQILDLSDMEFLDDSSTESLLLSGDEYNQDFDSTNFEESQDEEDGLNEIVRCICEMDEENGFMIQVSKWFALRFSMDLQLEVCCYGGIVNNLEREWHQSVFALPLCLLSFFIVLLWRSSKCSSCFQVRAFFFKI